MADYEKFNWVTKAYLKERVQDEEIILIDDFLSEMEKSGQLTEQKRVSIVEDVFLFDHLKENHDHVKVNNNEMPIPKLLFNNLFHKEVPTQVKVPVKEPIQRELPVLQQIEEMLKKSPLRKRPVCEFYVNDQVYKGKVEGMRNGCVYLSEAYGMRWRGVPLSDIYRIKVLT
ncbi:MAG: hypothetical protein K0R71_1278 [Bacillales bacterium]|jgi:hypothetical protein|nr:hypothetical protein [Bacillales bacterium]